MGVCSSRGHLGTTEAWRGPLTQPKAGGAQRRLPRGLCLCSEPRIQGGPPDEEQEEGRAKQKEEHVRRPRGRPGGLRGLSSCSTWSEGRQDGEGGRGRPWRALQTPLRNGDLMESDTSEWRYLRVSVNLSLKLSLIS